jgi:catechol 2,3-dioxygenase-like lactoylglutathione lyase family enzyme
MTDTLWTQGVHHVGLTVPDLGAARRFFMDTLGCRQVGEVADYPAVFLSDGQVMITLWRAENPSKAVAFDRKNVVGLHHLALRVAGDEALEALHRRLSNADGVEIEFAPEPLGSGPTRHMMCRMPGGIRLELIAAS